MTRTKPVKLTKRNVFTLPPGEGGRSKRYGDPDCKTLFLAVSGRNRRSWVQRLHVGGVRVDRGLGSLEFISLAEARAIASKNRYAARTGGRLFAVEKPDAPPAPAFKTAAAECRAANADMWSKATAAKWSSIERRHLAPLADIPVTAITRDRVIALLRGLTPATAKHAKRQIKMAFEIAIIRRWCEDNPAVGIDSALPHMRRAETAHHEAANYAAAPSIFARLAAAGPEDAASAVLGFLMLTAVRSMEARGVLWSEIDLAARLWSIPGNRMKTRKPHVVPLSDAAVDLLERRCALTGGGGLVFAGERRPGRPAPPVADKTMGGRLRNGEGTPHGLRSTFRDWAADCTQHAREVAEAALAHMSANGSATERAYARSTHLDRRKTLMQDWADFLTGGGE